MLIYLSTVDVIVLYDSYTCELAMCTVYMYIYMFMCMQCGVLGCACDCVWRCTCNACCVSKLWECHYPSRCTPDRHRKLGMDMVCFCIFVLYVCKLVHGNSYLDYWYARHLLIFNNVYTIYLWNGLKRGVTSRSDNSTEKEHFYIMLASPIPLDI